MFIANENRYDTMKYNRCGNSGLMLPAVATVLIGASRPEQISENVACINNLEFTAEEMAEIEAILAE